MIKPVEVLHVASESYHLLGDDPFGSPFLADRLLSWFFAHNSVPRYAAGRGSKFVISCFVLPQPAGGISVAVCQGNRLMPRAQSVRSRSARCPYGLLPLGLRYKGTKKY